MKTTLSQFSYTTLEIKVNLNLNRLLNSKCYTAAHAYYTIDRATSIIGSYTEVIVEYKKVVQYATKEQSRSRQAFYLRCEVVMH